MECINHPNHNAIDVCYVCSKPICLGCKTTLIDKIMCLHCAKKVIKDTVEIFKAKNEKYITEKRANATKRELDTRKETTFLPTKKAFSSSLFNSMCSLLIVFK